MALTVSIKGVAHSGRDIEVWTELTAKELEAIPGVELVFHYMGNPSAKHFNVYVDPRWGKAVVADAITKAAHDKANQGEGKR